MWSVSSWMPLHSSHIPLSQINAQIITHNTIRSSHAELRSNSAELRDLLHDILTNQNDLRRVIEMQNAGEHVAESFMFAGQNVCFFRHCVPFCSVLTLHFRNYVACVRLETSCFIPLLDPHHLHHYLILETLCPVLETLLLFLKIVSDISNYSGAWSPSTEILGYPLL